MVHVIPPGQPETSVNPRDYKIRIIVAGTRGYADRQEFHNVMCKYIERFEGPILFISGKATSGADDLIIKWCKKFNYPCLEMPALWDDLDVPGAVIKTRSNGQKYNVVAGFQRNNKMSEIGTHMVNFFDGDSSGSQQMIEKAMEDKIQVKIVNIKLPEKTNE